MLQPKNKAGTFLYIAPEIIRNGIFNEKSDMWSLGCIIYELFHLNNYYQDKFDGEIKIIDSTIYNNEWQELIDSLLQIDYKKRLDINRVNEFILLKIENKIKINKTNIIYDHKVKIPLEKIKKRMKVVKGSSQAIGIDLGGINSYVSVFLNGKAEIIPNELGGRKTPSYLAFTDKEILIGETAKNQMRKNPKNTIFYLERLIGKKYNEKYRNNNMKYLPFKITKDNSNDPQIQITYKNEEKKFYPENLLSMILQKLKKNASDYLGKDVTDAVITVPTIFNSYQIDEIKEASKNSGLNIIRILTSSTAAGLTYCYNTLTKGKFKKSINVLIFDLGGFSLNLSLISFENGLIEVKSTNGNLNLGGEDFSYRLFDYCAYEFRKQTGIDINNNLKAISRLLNSCEEAKITLSSSTEAYIELEYLIDKKDFNIKITRDKFEDLCFDLFKKCIPPIKNILKDADLVKTEIDDIILVGSSTRIPKIHQIIKEFFNGKEINKELNREEAIAYGAAIQSAILTNTKDDILDL